MTPLRKLPALTIAALALVLAAPAAPAAPVTASQPKAGDLRQAAVATPRTPEPPRLQRRGRWLVDPQGRVVIVHGLNLVYKHDPYVPPATAAGFTARDARWLRRMGFNAARIGTLWAGLTPDAPGRVDATYVAKWQRIMDLLARRKIWMQLDFHQDQWHETYGGEGAPDWAMKRPSPYDLGPPPGLPFPQNYWTPEVSAVFDNFWANADGLRDGWIRAWEVAAREWRDQPYSMGYDLLNEPWAGSEWTSCLATGCPSTYAEELQPAFEAALRAIRVIDPSGIVWWEPQQFAGGQPLDTFFTKAEGERNLGFSWHNYCPEVFLESQGLPGSDVEKCTEFATGRQEHALEQAREMNAVPMMSEWGATDNVRAIEIDADVADRYLMGWSHWAYKRWNDPTTADDAQGLFRDDADPSTVKTEKVRRLVRTYAQATAGRPLRMRFDATSGAFDYRFRPWRRVNAPTRIFVSPLHYSQGWRVRVRHGRVVRRSERTLLVRPTSRRPVVVRVRARGGS